MTFTLRVGTLSTDMSLQIQRAIDMADSTKLMPHILKFEGGFANDAADSGGATMKGVTLATFRRFYGPSCTVGQLRDITDEQWLHIFKTGYWDKCRADDIESQSVADAIVDWAYNSGPGTAIRKVQTILQIKVDGIIGPQTLKAINDTDAEWLFDKIQSSRISFVEAIVHDKPSQAKFINGWKNRINSIRFIS